MLYHTSHPTDTCGDHPLNLINGRMLDKEENNIKGVGAEEEVSLPIENSRQAPKSL